MNEVFVEACQRYRIVPVAVIDDADRAPALGRALIAGGLPLIEVTLRTPDAPAAITALVSDGGRASGLIVGAGTVVTTDQVDAAVEAGAQFIVSPGYNPAVVARAQGHGVAALPGVATAGEMMAAMNQGLSCVKFFPAAQLGGPKGLAAFASVFPTLSFIPTGGVSMDNLSDYLAMESVIAVGGSWMLPRALIGSGDVDTIERLVREAVTAAAKDAQ